MNDFWKKLGIDWDEVEDPIDGLGKTKYGKDINKTLVKRQRRSSAVETLFTMSLLTFFWLQLTGGPRIFGSSAVAIETSFNLGVDLIYFITMYGAWLLGGESLKLELMLSLKKKFS